MDYQSIVRNILDGHLSLEEFFSKDNMPDHLGNNILFYCFSSKSSKIINYAQNFKPSLFNHVNNDGDTMLVKLLNSNLSYFKNILYKNPSLFCVKNKKGNTILYNLHKNIGPVGKFILKYTHENHPDLFYSWNDKHKTFLFYLNSHDEESIRYILDFVQENCSKLFYYDNFLEKYFENPMPTLNFIYKHHPSVFENNKKFLLHNISGSEIFDFVLEKMPQILLETDFLEKKTCLFFFTSNKKITQKVFEYIFTHKPELFKVYLRCNNFLSYIRWNKIDIETTKYIMNFCLENFPELFSTIVHNSVDDPFCNVLMAVSFERVSNESTEFLFDFVTTHFPEILTFRNDRLKFYSKYV